jgi:hypothetical protein
MLLRKVEQYHKLGCFTACLAMMLNKSYFDTIKIVHPNKYFGLFSKKSCDVAISIEGALMKLEEVGIKALSTNIKIIKDFKKDALLIVRWKSSIDSDVFLHTIMYDSCQKKILDPAHKVPFSNKRYERALDSAYIIQ